MYYYTFGIFTVEGLAHAILRVKGAQTINIYIYVIGKFWQYQTRNYITQWRIRMGSVQ